MLDLNDFFLFVQVVDQGRLHGREFKLADPQIDAQSPRPAARGQSWRTAAQPDVAQVWDDRCR